MSDTNTKFRIAGVEHEFDVTTLLNIEIIAIKKATGLGLHDWLAGLQTADMDALTALVWVMRKREEPTLKFSDVVFSLSDIQPVEADPADDEFDEDGADGSVPTEAVDSPE